MIIGLTGTNASGKGEVAKYLKEKGFQYLSLSDIVRHEAKFKGLELTRENLILTGNLMRAQFGPDILAQRTIKKITKKNCVIDSIRNLAEAKAIKKLPDSMLIAVDAPSTLRYERSQKRKEERDKISYAEFQKLEQQENFKSETGQQLKLVMKEADKLIINDGLLMDLHKEIDDLL
jgi:dephospho-CoA kinase